MASLTRGIWGGCFLLALLVTPLFAEDSAQALALRRQKLITFYGQEAQTSVEEKRMDRALRALHELLGLDPKHAEATALRQKLLSAYGPEVRPWLTQARDAAKEITVASQKVLTLCSVADAYVRIADVKTAKEVLMEAQEAIPQITDEMERTYTLIEVTGSLAKAGLFPEASRLAARAPDEFFRGMASAEVARGQIRAGLGAEAFQTASSITDERGKAKTLRQIVQAQVLWADLDAARKTVSVLQQLAESVTENLTKESVLAELAGAQAALGNLDEALKSVDAIKDEYRQSMALAKAVNARTQVGDVGQAKALLERLTKLGELAGKATALRSMADLQFRLDHLDEARKTLRQAREAASEIDPDKLANDLDLFCTATRQAHAGDLEQAMKTAQSIRDHGRMSLAVAEIAEAHVKIGDVSRAKDLLALAERVAAKMTDLRSRAFYFQRMAQVQQHFPADQRDLAWIKALKDPCDRAMATVGAARGCLPESAFE